MQPTIINITVLNSLRGQARIVREPLLESSDANEGQPVRASFAYASEAFQWASYLAVFLEVSPDAANFTGTASARIQIHIEVDAQNRTEEHVVDFWLRVNIVPTPSRSQRVLWDQYHNLGYPHGFVPRDDLRQRSNPLDWHADHPHTNFRSLHQRLRSNGYYVEVLREPATCIDLGLYAAYLLVDPEEEFFRQEIHVISGAVKEGRTNLLVFADWFNSTLIEKIQFIDETTGKVWMPATGGCNVPALNELLRAFGFALGDEVFEGNVELGDTVTDFNSGSAIIRAPKDAILGFGEMNDLGWELISGQPSSKKARAPVFGYDTPTNSSGFVTVFGDSDCLENESCFELLDILLHAASTEGRLPRTIADHLSRPREDRVFSRESSLPRRFISTDFAKHSKTVLGYTRNLKPARINESQFDQFLEQSSLNASALSIEVILDDAVGGYSASGTLKFVVFTVFLAVLLLLLYVARAFHIPRVLLKTTLVRPLRQFLRRML
ncbi:Membrane-bound transcription factor site-1 protease precursor [Aphelenchoides avenae]|nr:Membrane-bound transcription factor site-1 protease precursor [Aphelenchus avenae]